MKIPVSIIAKKENGNIFLKEIKSIEYNNCLNDITEGLEMNMFNTEYSFCILYNGIYINNIVLISSGTTFEAPLCTRNIISSIVLSNATSFSMLHNHPSGNHIPSKMDIANLNTFSEISNLLDVNFNESYITSGTGVQGVNAFLNEIQELESEDENEW